jgi:hypothetical protein
METAIVSQSLAWDQDEENAEGSVYQNSDSKNHDRSADEEFADVLLPDAGEVEGCVLA